MSSNPETRRLFLALWPDDEVRRAVADLAGTVPGGQPVQAQNLHLTLVFLGATTAERLGCYEAALRDLEVPSLSLTLDRFGYFPRPRTLWLGASRTPAVLVRLVEELNRRLQTCGFTPEKRPFRVHVTLARKHPGPAPVEPVAEPPCWAVDHIALCESVNRADGVHYQVLRRWPR